MGIKCCTYTKNEAVKDKSQLDFSRIIQCTPRDCADFIEVPENAEINSVSKFKTSPTKFTDARMKSAEDYPAVIFVANKVSSGDCSIQTVGNEFSPQLIKSVQEEQKMLAQKKFSVFRAQSEWTNANDEYSHAKIAAENFRIENKNAVHEKYIFSELIGKGAFGEVWKATERNSGSFRAAKIIAKDKCIATASFDEEIQILQKLVYFILTLYSLIGSSKHFTFIRILPR